jgi:hypothetical protein
LYPSIGTLLTTVLKRLVVVAVVGTQLVAVVVELIQE